MRFADTSILLYAVSAGGDAGKAEVAGALLAERDIALSTQVLQEFYVQATRPTRSDAMTHRDASDLVTAFGRFPVCDVTAGIVAAAIDTHQRFRISYWDAAIIEAARAMDCHTVLSDDLSDTTDYAGVRVVNPFWP